MALEVIGKIHEIYNAQQVSERFTKREFVVEVQDGAYAQYVKFQLNQERCNLIDQYAIGDDVKVSFSLSGRPFQGRDGNTQYFTNLVAYRLDRAGAGAPAADAGAYRQPYAQQSYSQAPAAAPAASSSSADTDDLPF
ncbi:MAG: DUF3127 domain-containing protein [Bacteroidota bacterium]